MSECLRRWQGASGRCDEWSAGGASGSIAERTSIVGAVPPRLYVGIRTVAVTPLPQNQRYTTIFSR